MAVNVTVYLPAWGLVGRQVNVLRTGLAGAGMGNVAPAGSPVTLRRARSPVSGSVAWTVNVSKSPAITRKGGLVSGVGGISNSGARLIITGTLIVIGCGWEEA